MDAFCSCSGGGIGFPGLPEAHGWQGCLLCLMRHGGLLRKEAGFKFATCARNSGADFRSKSNFTSFSGGYGLDFAGKYGQFNFFRFRAVIDGDGRATLRAELFAASLIHSFKRP